MTLAESCVAGAVGVEVDVPDELSPAQALCSESPGRVVVTVDSRNVRTFAQLCADAQVALTDIGTVGGQRLAVGGLLDLGLADVEAALRDGLPQVLEG